MDQAKSAKSIGAILHLTEKPEKIDTYAEFLEKEAREAYAAFVEKTNKLSESEVRAALAR